MAEQQYPESFKMISVGFVGTGPFSFGGDYIQVINGIGQDYNPLNMRVTHIWGDDYSKNYKGSPEYVKKNVDLRTTGVRSPQGLAKRYNIPNVCKNFHEMVDEVDAAMIMDFDEAYRLSEPFLRKGKPIFLCSPVAISVPECERILDLAEANNAAVFSGSFTVGYPHNEILRLRVKRDEIASFFASTSLGYYTSYANDGLEPMHFLIDSGVRKVQLIGWDGSKGYDPTGIPISRILLEYKPRGDNPPIQGVMQLGGFKRESEWFRVYYHDHTILEGSAIGGNRELSFRDFMILIQQTFATNKSPETREDILSKLKVVIGAYKSANEGNRPVMIEEVGDYRMPTIRIEDWDVIPD